MKGTMIIMNSEPKDKRYMKNNIKDSVSIDSEYLKKLNMHSRDGYDIYNTMFSQKSILRRACLLSWM